MMNNINCNYLNLEAIKIMKELKNEISPLPKKYYSENILNFLFAEDVSENDYLTKLTIREKEIFMLIKNGMQNKDIANNLFLSVKTIENHVENGLPPIGRHRKKVLNYNIGGVYGSKKAKEVQ